MSNKHQSIVVAAFTNTCMIAGALIMLSQSWQSPTAQLVDTEQGSVLAIESLKSAAAVVTTPDVTAELIFGMILLMIGFAFHALFVIRSESVSEDPVQEDRHLDKNTRYLEVMWFEGHRNWSNQD